VEPLPFFSRLFYAWLVYFKIIFDGVFAAKVKAMPQLPLPDVYEKALPEKKEKAKAEEEEEEAKAEAPKKKEPEKKAEEPKKPEPPKEPDLGPALQLLALLQREGRFVDFLEEDVASFSDSDIGAAARVVHAGCRKALREHVKLEPLRAEDEGKKITLDEGFDPASVKLTGNVSGKGPFTGTLRHRGWRAKSVALPEAVAGHDAKIIAQAELEL
jgi:hypothetical protein